MKGLCLTPRARRLKHAAGTAALWAIGLAFIALGAFMLAAWMASPTIHTP